MGQYHIFAQSQSAGAHVGPCQVHAVIAVWTVALCGETPSQDTPASRVMIMIQTR